MGKRNTLNSAVLEYRPKYVSKCSVKLYSCSVLEMKWEQRHEWITSRFSPPTLSIRTQKRVKFCKPLVPHTAPNWYELKKNFHSWWKILAFRYPREPDLRKALGQLWTWHYYFGNSELRRWPGRMIEICRWCVTHEGYKIESAPTCPVPAD